MPSFFRKSPERITDTLFPVCMEVAMNIARHNFLQLPQRSMAYVRFVVGSGILTNLWCQNSVGLADSYGATSFEISRLMTEKHLAQISRHFSQKAMVADIVVWQEEIDHFTRCPSNPALADAYSTGARLPLHDIVRELYVVRSMTMVKDLGKGSAAALQKTGFTLALLMPACCSLRRQTTADMDRAGDERIVAGFAASVLANWMFLQTSLQEAFR